MIPPAPQLGSESGNLAKRTMESPSGRMRAVGFLAVLIGVALVAPLGAYDAELPDGWSLGVTPPPEWRVEKRSGSLAVTLRLFSSQSAKHPTVQITTFALPAGQPAHTSDEIRAKVEVAGRGILPTALQPSLEIRPLRLSAGTAFYYHLTDRQEERGEGDFRELHQGMGEIAGHVVTFTVLSHTGEDQLVETSLAVLATLRISK